MSEKIECDNCSKKRRRRNIIIFKGKFLCSDCFYKRCNKMPKFNTSITKKIKSIERERKYNKEYKKKLREGRKEKGLCVSCGRKKKAKKYLMCLKCRKKYRKMNAKYMEKDREKLNKRFRDYYRKKHNIPPEKWRVKD